MGVTANRVNKATSVYSSILNPTPAAVTNKYFSLHNNVLDGTFKLLGNDVGWWDSVVADAGGNISPAAQLTCSDADYLHTIRLIGYAPEANYPVDFTIVFYTADNTAVYTKTVTGNTNTEYIFHLPATYQYDHYIVTITKISQPSYAAKIINLYNPHIIARTDLFTVTLAEESRLSGNITIVNLFSSDTFTLPLEIPSKIRNQMYKVENFHLEDVISSDLINAHKAFMEANRTIFGKVKITYNNPFIDIVTITTPGDARNRSSNLLIDSYKDDGVKHFNLFDNVLDGSHKVSGPLSQVAWNGITLSDAEGNFASAQVLTLTFNPLFLAPLTISGDSSFNNYPVTGVVTITLKDTSTQIIPFADNDQNDIIITSTYIKDVISVSISVTKISKPNAPLAISEIPVLAAVTYREDGLKSIDLLEELTYEDTAEALGGVSANELTVNLNNSNKQFFFNNEIAISAKQLKKNRKVEAWLGTLVLGEIEWYKLGVFWSQSWTVPTNELHVQVTAFDTLALLDTTMFTNHQVYEHYSLGALFELVLADAQEYLGFSLGNIDPSLYNIYVDVAWFEYKSHTQALKRLASCYPINVYCDRDGIIQVQAKLHGTEIDYWNAKWQNSTNIKTLSYPTRYATLPNYIDVNIYTIKEVPDTQLLNDVNTYTITDSKVSKFRFTPVAKTITNVSITVTGTVTYTYKAYSWGIVITFTGTGTVTAIMVTGIALDVSSKSVYNVTNEESVELDGMEKRTIDSQLVQGEERAKFLAEYALADVSRNIYDAKVTYTGDASLTLNNVIYLPDVLYRHLLCIQLNGIN